ncbi:DegT/DnrJ/EryC1/StrS family aminotransferase [Streptomyces xiaopingdaonensis]|uniref:DegT/DnrJ/EryC1/StrS family aminotransferase n=1 Tax=Streptomyces xiaopingdaonensis TaxID=1565415 RepID=UPI0002E6295B|nr:DegT/DnrJ/EryC1/StrS family aminotransferase [Streptomyces xiaopingdaonensis]
MDRERNAPENVPAAQPVIGEEEIEAAVRVLRSGRVVQGPEVAAFEEEFAEFVDGRACVAVNSGTSALHLSLLALGIGHGDEVVVPSFSFAATANAVRLAGAEPVFAEIDPETFCLDPDAAASAIGPRTAALLPVHLYGHPAAADRLGALARRYGLALVEDACQAHGAALHDERVGTFGEAACFSFYPTKNMHALEGGMVAVEDAELARTLRLLRNQGMEQRYANEIVGANMRMTDVAAAVGRVQLGRLPAYTERRRANAKALDSGITTLATPPVADGARHVYHQYTVRVPGGRRDAVQRELELRGVGSAVYYPTPIHRLTPYAHQQAGLPETDRAAAEVLSLPVHPTLTAGDLARVVGAVDEAAAAAGAVVE